MGYTALFGSPANTSFCQDIPLVLWIETKVPNQNAHMHEESYTNKMSQSLLFLDGQGQMWRPANFSFLIAALQCALESMSAGILFFPGRYIISYS